MYIHVCKCFIRFKLITRVSFYCARGVDELNLITPFFLFCVFRTSASSAVYCPDTLPVTHNCVLSDLTYIVRCTSKSYVTYYRSLYREGRKESILRTLYIYKKEKEKKTKTQEMGIQRFLEF